MNSSSAHDDLDFSSALLGVCVVNTNSASWRAAEIDGWDMTQVADALRIPGEERLREHNAALQQIEAMREEFVSQYGQFAEAR